MNEEGSSTQPTDSTQRALACANTREGHRFDEDYCCIRCGLTVVMKP